MEKIKAKKMIKIKKGKYDIRKSGMFCCQWGPAVEG